MAPPPFRFSLEPKRVAAAAARDATQGELVELGRERKLARDELCNALKSLRVVAQRLRRELDEQFLRPLCASEAREWTWSCQYIEQLRELQAQRDKAAQRRRERLALVELKLENKRAELAERQQQFEALERALERERTAHRRAQLNEEERRRDDDAPLEWMRKLRETQQRP